MRITHLLIVACSLLPFATLASQHKLPLNNPEVLQSLNKYFSSGEYIQEIETKALEAKSYLDQRLKKTSGDSLAIVFDIDETALSNLEALQRNNYSTNMEAFTANYLFSTLPAIGPTLGLYNYAKRRNVKLFFITSRPNTPEVINATVRNLKQAGFADWEDLYLMPLEDNNLTTAEFKKQSRQMIQNMGYTIVLNIGDQESDISGGVAEVAIKYPNPFYSKA